MKRGKMDIGVDMSEKAKSNSSSNGDGDKKQARLSDALRANLKRRKAAQRKKQSKDGGTAPSTDKV